MTEPLRIPLSDAQRKRLAAYESQIAALQSESNAVIQFAIEGVASPSFIVGWQYAVRDGVIVVMPPPDAG